MKKTLGIIAVLGAALALCLALVGCGGSSEPVDASGFYGDWQVTSITTDEADSTVSEEDMAMMASLDMYVTLTLNEDGSCSLDLFGDVEEGTWKAKSSTEATITMQGQDIDTVLSGDTLTLSQEDAVMVCARA